MAWTVHTGGLSIAAGLLYLGGIAWTLHYDTIYAHQDKDDDALIGLKSTARLFDSATVPILAGFCAIAIICATVAAAITLSGLKLAIALVAIALYAVHLVWQLIRLDIDNGDVCLKLFRENRDTGLILLFGFLLAGLL
jgi:4-hydroxybenzoate polyprenyltransferase